MVNWAWTGSRPPPGGFSVDEIIFVALDVARTLNPGDTVLVGACRGVDELVMRTAVVLSEVVNLSIITYEATKEPSWHLVKAPDDLLKKSSYRIDGMTYLERDRAMVSAADFVRAIPLRPLPRDNAGSIQRVRGSGTAYTASHAQLQSKLIAELPLRPAA